MQGLVTVFGGSGFIGSQVVRALAKKGLRVRVAVRRPGRGYRLPMLGDVGQIEVVQANIRDAASVGRALDGAQAAVNLVAVLYETGRQGFAALHVDGAALIAQEAAARGITRFVQVSAIGADAASASLYGRTKAAGEAAVRQAVPTAAVIRPSIVFGAQDAFFNRFAAMASVLPALPLVGGGMTRFQPVHVADVAAAVAACVTDPATEGRTYELGGPSVYTFKALLEYVLEQTGRRRTLVPLPFPVAGLIGAVGDVQARLTPIPPVLTADQVALLKTDNVVTPGALGLADLGVQPTPLEAVVPGYLGRFRRGGQFADKTAAV